MGVHGWEAVSTSYLESGRYLAGGAHSYAVGRYEVDAKKVVIRATLTLYGNGPTLFGKASGAPGSGASRQPPINDKGPTLMSRPCAKSCLEGGLSCRCMP